MNTYSTEVVNGGAARPRARWPEALVEKVSGAIKGRKAFPPEIEKIRVSFEGRDIELFDLRDAPLAGRDFTNGDLSYTALDGADLSGCNFTGAWLQYCRLNGASLNETVFYQSQASPVDARKADFRGSRLSKSFFMYSDFSCAVLDRCKLDGNFFEGACLTSASFNGAFGADYDAVKSQSLTGDRLVPEPAGRPSSAAFFQILSDWIDGEKQRGAPIGYTDCALTIKLGRAVLTRNEDIAASSIQEHIEVSAYPLAMWLAKSWWRLVWEPLPKLFNAQPPQGWRNSHEMVAAGEGFLWPQVVFASDTETMQISASAEEDDIDRPIRFLTRARQSLRLGSFESSLDSFVSNVLNRLEGRAHRGTDLRTLWDSVVGERHDPIATRYRKMEAAMGYDVREAPRDFIEEVLNFRESIGSDALAELAPLYGRFGGGESLAHLAQLREAPGLLGKPNLPRLTSKAVGADDRPWVRAVAAAQELRRQSGVVADKVSDRSLLDLLGVHSSQSWEPSTSRTSSVGVPLSQGQVRFVPRKTHPNPQRFEMARFLGDLVHTEGQHKWLASTDLITARQKFQRAFAAEFLCPADRLLSFLNGDHSDSAVEDAAVHFAVGEQTVRYVLANNGNLGMDSQFGRHAALYA
ncbi:hypothetical protein GCM10007320_41050 [Pseudorhodoferax aquiterrae]|uniref:Pentapeptide repeat protein n=1 Tax=Pseudorhodoferax aquiterrae TaxID=747304 RepID=A0ABQ3G5S1_9BURK|nr:pentapeptide repeat-containing protein [Pseudorhodoferax aquiterrae]GHC91744.1 hypothetical protein GCM10007320_41050 [Pseudorhodoferax aquiterrae]